MTWTPQSHGPIPGIIPQSTMVPPGLGQPSLHHAPYMGYPPLFPPVPPHVRAVLFKEKLQFKNNPYSYINILLHVNLC